MVPTGLTQTNFLSDSLDENLSNRDGHDDAVLAPEEGVNLVEGVTGEVEGDEKIKRMSRRNILERHNRARLDKLGEGKGEKTGEGKSGQTFSAGLSFCRRSPWFRAACGRATSPPAMLHQKQSYKPASFHLPERPCCGVVAAVAVVAYTIPRRAHSPRWEGITQKAPLLTSMYSSLNFLSQNSNIAAHTTRHNQR
jgi:hypothetical protein